MLYLCTRKHEESIFRVMQRGVAQPGSAPGLGPGGRRFESCRPDKYNEELGMAAKCGHSFLSIDLIPHSSFLIPHSLCVP